MNLYEFCEEFKISLGKARKMQKRNVLRLDGDDAAASGMRHYLGRGQPLTAAMLCTLVEEPSLLMDLGRHSERAQEQLAELGNAKDEAAPRHIAAHIADAAKNDPDAVQVLLEWLYEIIPAKPVGHSFIAVRLLLGLSPNVRQFDIGRIPRALYNCRKHADFSPYWRVLNNGTRNATIYQQPPTNFIDL